MISIIRVALASLLIAGFVGVTGAGERDQWSIVQASGEIWVQTGGAQAVSLGDARTLEPGTTLATSAGGRVVLQRGDQSMVVGPNTIMQVPPELNWLFTTIVQMTGDVAFEVDKRDVKHFSVKTPYLAAAVKGTRFAVHAGTNGDSVVVERGLVEVRSLLTDDSVDLRPGQRADVSGDGLFVFDGIDGANPASGGSASNASAPSQGSGGLSLGLGGTSGLNANIGGGSASVGLGGPNGVSASVGGSGASVGVGGSGGLGLSAGGGGVSVNVGGLGLGIGGP